MNGGEGMILEEMQSKREVISWVIVYSRSASLTSPGEIGEAQVDQRCVRTLNMGVVNTKKKVYF